MNNRVINDATSNHTGIKQVLVCFAEGGTEMQNLRDANFSIFQRWSQGRLTYYSFCTVYMYNSAVVLEKHVHFSQRHALGENTNINLQNCVQ